MSMVMVGVSMGKEDGGGVAAQMFYASKRQVIQE
jgi:hypothetical protein